MHEDTDLQFRIINLSAVSVLWLKGRHLILSQKSNITKLLFGKKCPFHFENQ